MRFVKMEATTFLIRKKGLNPEAFGIQTTCLVCRGYIRKQMERLLIAYGQATEEHHRAICCFRDVHIRERDQGPRLDTGRHGLTSEALPIPQHSDVTPCSDHVGPMSLLQGVLKLGAIKLTMAQQHHRCPQWD